MAVRPIDGDALLKELTCNFTGDAFHGNRKVTIGEVRRTIKSMPTLTQPNEPLTLEELRRMDEPTPVWWDWVSGWALARHGMIVPWSGRCHEAEELRGIFYRRPPEGQT